MPVAPVFCGAYLLAFGIVALGIVVVVVPGAVAVGSPGEVVVALGVVVVDVPVALGACVAAKAAPAPSAVRTTAKVAFLAAMFIKFLRLRAPFRANQQTLRVPRCSALPRNRPT